MLLSNFLIIFVKKQFAVTQNRVADNNTDPLSDIAALIHL
jgi:hypothetical protein